MDSVTSIPDSAFSGCTSLESVTFKGPIASGSFPTNSFPGDLQSVFYATNKTNGTTGLYTWNNSGNTWEYKGL
jgi:hypothetical protein